jgi:hypothetical protein
VKDFTCQLITVSGLVAVRRMTGIAPYPPGEVDTRSAQLSQDVISIHSHLMAKTPIPANSPATRRSDRAAATCTQDIMGADIERSHATARTNRRSSNRCDAVEEMQSSGASYRQHNRPSTDNPEALLKCRDWIPKASSQLAGQNCLGFRARFVLPYIAARAGSERLRPCDHRCLPSVGRHNRRTPGRYPTCSRNRSEWQHHLLKLATSAPSLRASGCSWIAQNGFEASEMDPGEKLTDENLCPSC